MKMKKIVFLIMAVVMLSISSCSDFMEFPPAASFNIDSVFSKYSNAQKLVYDLYSYPIPLNFDTRSFGSSGTRMAGGSFASALTDEGQSYDVQPGYQVQRYYTGNVEPYTCASWTSSAKGEDDYATKWKTIRKAYILLDNIDRVPDVTFPTNQGIAPQVQKDRIKAEAKLMIALVYFEMWKRYGGVPIVTRQFSTADSYESYKTKRATFEETYNFIIALLDEVMTKYKDALPARISVSEEFGRFPMAFAYGLKARVELYAASPLFNTDRPYSTALGANSNLICFMNYDKERWKKAADAATVAINYAIANGYALVDDATKRESGENYRVANVEHPYKGNTELMWGVVQSNNGNWQNFTVMRGPTSVYYGYAPNLVPLNQVERYEKDTTIAGQYKNWDAMQTYSVSVPTGTTDDIVGGMAVATSARKAYAGLDPRFYASICYNGMSPFGTQSKAYGKTSYIDMADGYTGTVPGTGSVNAAKHGVYSFGKHRTTVLHYVRKFTNGYDESENSMSPINIYMRLAELYLIRAEALNEYNAAPTQQIYDDLNFIRNRSGMVGVLTGQDQAQMRKTIEHERNIELFYEDQRWFDLRRTLQSETKIPVNIYKIQIRKWYRTSSSSWPYAVTYEKVLLNKRVWFNKWYMNPFPGQEIDKNYGLIQNPGW